MQDHAWTILATLVALTLYFFMGMRVGAARHKYKLEAPATTGEPGFERRFRVHMNTLEWLPIFLVSLWLFSFYWGDKLAAGLGAVWIVGRFLYMTGYEGSARGRGLGFLIQGLTALALLIGSFVGVVQALLAAS